MRVWLGRPVDLDQRAEVRFESLCEFRAPPAPMITTHDHYLLLLYVLASGQKNEIIRFPVEGVDGGSISMLAVQLG